VLPDQLWLIWPLSSRPRPSRSPLTWHDCPVPSPIHNSPRQIDLWWSHCFPTGRGLSPTDSVPLPQDADRRQSRAQSITSCHSCLEPNISALPYTFLIGTEGSVPTPISIPYSVASTSCTHDRKQRSLSLIYHLPRFWARAVTATLSKRRCRTSFRLDLICSLSYRHDARISYG
jgi:hypothetical protein